MDIIFLITGLIIGILFTYFILKYKFNSEKGISLERNNIFKENLDTATKDLKEKNDIISNLISEKARVKTDNKNLIQKLDEQKSELEN